jgi:hypothetical protein
LNQFEQNKINKFTQLHQLFGNGAQPEFPMTPNNFLLFIDSISGKIIQLHEQSQRIGAERKTLTERSEREKVFHSNSLIVLNRQSERRISLLKQFHPE